MCVACVTGIRGQCLRRVGRVCGLWTWRAWRVYVVPEQSRVTGKAIGACDKLRSNQRRHRSWQRTSHLEPAAALTGTREWQPPLPGSATRPGLLHGLGPREGALPRPGHTALCVCTPGPAAAGPAVEAWTPHAQWGPGPWDRGVLQVPGIRTGMSTGALHYSASCRPHGYLLCGPAGAQLLYSSSRKKVSF